MNAAAAELVTGLLSGIEGDRVKVTCPPDRIRAVYCKAEMGEPPSMQVFYLDLDYLLMSCPSIVDLLVRGEDERVL